MRVTILVGMMSLAGVASAQAAPITLQFNGVIGSIATSVSQHVAPSLAVGDPFTAFVTFRDPTDPTSLVNMAFGSSLSGSAICASCLVSTLNTTTANTINVLPGTMLGLPTAFSPGGYIQQSLFSLSLNAGWQTGTMFIWLENVFVGGGVSGRVTSMQVVNRSVPEPMTAVMLAIGVVGLASLRRRRGRQGAQPV